MRFDIITLFPDIFTSYLRQSILNKAIEAKLVEVHLWNLRDWSTNKHQTVDDRPYGGGPGMLIMAEPVFLAVEEVQSKDPTPATLVMLTPSGQRLNHNLVLEMVKRPRYIFLCGRYEGFDERIRIGLNPLEVSIGDFVCNGGEVPAMVLMDSIIRFIPGVLGDETSLIDESHAQSGWLEYPQYTRPRVFRELSVPDVLLSGDHQAIAAWRQEMATRDSDKNK